ncbi:MAG: flagellar basal body-associated protein FliL [Francisellaceae bacterium]|jgi:flagellar basal body-associated protein FliL
MKKISLKIIFTVLIFIFTTSIATNSYSATSCTNNDWISALVAQNQPPNNIEIYVKQIHALAPNLKQISLFVTLNDITNISAYDNLLTQYAQLINLLR